MWGYEPSLDAMRDLIKLFSYDQALPITELVRMRYEACLDVKKHSQRCSRAPSKNARRNIRYNKLNQLRQNIDFPWLKRSGYTNRAYNVSIITTR